MKSTRRQIIKFVAIGTAGSLMGGCITKKLYEHDSYDEQLYSILISKDRKIIVAMTEKYHYIFDAPGDIIRALSEPFRPFLRASFNRFYVTSAGDIEGSYALILVPTALPEMRQMALAAGYTAPMKDDFHADKQQLEQRGTLHGKRYESNGIKPEMAEYYLNNSYKISIEAEQSYGRKVVNIPLTPITVAADGTVVIVEGAVQVVMLPFALLMMGVALGVWMSQ